jgi:hypothetical protein
MKTPKSTAASNTTTERSNTIPLIRPKSIVMPAASGHMLHKSSRVDTVMNRAVISLGPI